MAALSARLAEAVELGKIEKGFVTQCFHNVTVAVEPASMNHGCIPDFVGIENVGLEEVDRWVGCTLAEVAEQSCLDVGAVIDEEVGTARGTSSQSGIPVEWLDVIASCPSFASCYAWLLAHERQEGMDVWA